MMAESHCVNFRDLEIFGDVNLGKGRQILFDLTVGECSPYWDYETGSIAFPGCNEEQIAFYYTIAEEPQLSQI